LDGRFRISNAGGLMYANGVSVNEIAFNKIGLEVLSLKSYQKGRWLSVTIQTAMAGNETFESPKNFYIFLNDIL